MSEGLSILIIEDEDGIPAIIKLFMKKWASLNGFSLIHCTTLAAGIESAPKASIILLDLLLPPESNSVATLRRIPDLSQHAPVFVMTGAEDGNPGASELLRDSILIYGADFALFKSMLSNSAGVEFLMLTIQAALLRRERARREAKEGKTP